MKSSTVNTLLTDLLATLVDAYTVIADAPAPPKLQYVSFGEPGPYPHDVLAVWWAGTRLVNPFPLTKSSADFAAVMPAADLNFIVMRTCWPVVRASTSASSQLPKPAEIQAAAEAINADGATLMAHLSNLAVKGGMFPSLAIGNGDVAVSPVVPVGPQGTRVGVRGVVQVKLAIL